MKYFLLTFILTVNIYAYVDMSDVNNRANDLNMSSEDYAFSMAMAGAFTGSMFGLFLWKTK